MKFTALLFFSMALNAEAMTGNELYEKMRSKDTFDISVSLSYVNASVDAINFQRYVVDRENNRKMNICIPNGVTIGQSSDLVKNYLENNPKIRHLPAYATIYHVLFTEWPCKDD